MTTKRLSGNGVFLLIMASYFIYNGMINVELRMLGVFTRNGFCEWEKIEYYYCRNTEKNNIVEFRLKHIGSKKCVFISVGSNDKDIDKKILEENVALSE